MRITKDIFKHVTKLKTAYLNKDGKEVGNPKPMVLPVGMQRPASLQEQIERVVRQKMSQKQIDEGIETFEEANDFDVTDEFELAELKSNYDLLEDEYPVYEPENPPPSSEPATEPEPTPQPADSPPIPPAENPPENTA